MKQTNTVSQPTYDENLKTISFDGVDDYLITDNAFIYDSGQTDIYIIAKIPPANFHTIIFEGRNDIDTYYAPCRHSRFNFGAMSAGIVNDDGFVIFDSPILSEYAYNNTIRLYQWRDSLNAIGCRLNGGSIQSQSYSRIPPLSTDWTTIGSVIRGSGPEFSHEMSICEIVISENLNQTDREKMEGYLAWKWGTTEELPIDHPYKYDGKIFGLDDSISQSSSSSSL
jgi:hypothetical protein